MQNQRRYATFGRKVRYPVDPLQLAFQHLSSHFPITEVGRKGEMIVLQVGLSEDAAMASAISEPQEPLYDVLYPETRLQRNGDKRVVASHANRVRLEGLERIAKQLFEHGSVMLD